MRSDAWRVFGEVSGLVLSLAQLAVSLLVIFTMVTGMTAPQALHEAKSAIWGEDYTWGGTAMRDDGKPFAGMTVRLIYDDGTPVKTSDGEPVEAVTDKNGEYVLHARLRTHVKYRYEYITPDTTPDGN